MEEDNEGQGKVSEGGWVVYALSSCCTIYQCVMRTRDGQSRKKENLCEEVSDPVCRYMQKELYAIWTPHTKGCNCRSRKAENAIETLNLRNQRQVPGASDQVGIT